MRTAGLVCAVVVLVVAAATAGGRSGGWGWGGGGGGDGGGESSAAGGMTTQRRPVVKIRQGRLRGEWRTTARRKVPYASFRGIPYATPPLGSLRFKDPRPAQRWTGMLEATSFRNACTQMGTEGPIGDEDCLYLNVYVPRGAPGLGSGGMDPLPVLFYIPGGAFVRGSADRYGPDYFIEAGGALIVTINYRLGVFGFLNLGTADVPGNAALKDQNMALRWVRDNIAAFGGDPAKVTIFGQSAGGVSVHAHVLSPMSAGLFATAVSISGSLMAPWATPRNAVLQRQRLLDRVGCAGDKDTDKGKPGAPAPLWRPEHAAACLRAMPCKELVQAAGSVDLMREMLRDQQIPFTPTVDGTVPGATPFLPDTPENLISMGRFNRVPYANGVTSNEIIFFMASAPANTPEYLESGLSNITRQFKEKIQNALPDGLPPSAANISMIARDLYKPKSKAGEDLLESLVDASNDAFFVWPAVQSAHLHSLFEPRQYLYYFDLDARLDVRKPALHSFLNRLAGVPHGGDLFYLFRVPEQNATLPEDSTEMRTIRSYVQLLLNLAITGKPTPQPLEGVIWPNFQHDPDGTYLNFDERLLSIKSGLRKKQMMVWDILYMLTGRIVKQQFQNSTGMTNSSK